MAVPNRKLSREDCENIVHFCYTAGYIDLAEKIRDSKLHKMLQPKYRIKEMYG